MLAVLLVLLLIAVIAGLATVGALLVALAWPALPLGLQEVLFGLVTGLAVWTIAGCVQLVNLTIWQGDILRVYGVSLLLAAGLLRASGRTVLLLSIAFALGFVLLYSPGQEWFWERGGPGARLGLSMGHHSQAC